MLYLIEILHQTTTNRPHVKRFRRCILSKFYIKPQQCAPGIHFFIVVSYRNSTSNHNWRWIRKKQTKLYLIEILHQTTTQGDVRFAITRLYLIEILHQTTTWTASSLPWRGCILSKFYIKPQLRNSSVYASQRCILSKFYIKPQQGLWLFIRPQSCILSKFYIKPQPRRAILFRIVVVSYRNSTSNHNPRATFSSCL